MTWKAVPFGGTPLVVIVGAGTWLRPSPLSPRNGASRHPHRVFSLDPNSPIASRAERVFVERRGRAIVTKWTKWWSRKPSGPDAPSFQTIDAIIKKFEYLRDRLPDRNSPHDMQRLELFKGEMETLQSEAKYSTNLKNSEEQWASIGANRRHELVASAEQLFDDLMGLTRDERVLGGYCFFGFLTLLVIVTLAYGWRHQWWTQAEQLPTPTEATPANTKTATETTPTDEEIATVIARLHALELNLRMQPTSNDAASKSSPPPTRNASVVRVDPTRQAPTQGQLADALWAAIRQIELSFTTLQLLATVTAEAHEGTLTENSEYLASLKRALLADLESQRKGLFWSDRVGRWAEIAWWAEIGVLVGILFYIASFLMRGKFNREETSMMIAEIVIAPIAVPIIFFLFAFTGITSVSVGETSLPVTIGLAFILGYAIRRTLGVIDVIKTKIFGVFTEPSSP
jgi:hypothetical protein